MNNFVDNLTRHGQGQLHAPQVSSAQGNLVYLGYELAVAKHYLRLLANGFKVRGVKVSDYRNYYGLKGRTAGEVYADLLRMYDWFAGLIQVAEAGNQLHRSIAVPCIEDTKPIHVDDEAQRRNEGYGQVGSECACCHLPLPAAITPWVHANVDWEAVHPALDETDCEEVTGAESQGAFPVCLRCAHDHLAGFVTFGMNTGHPACAIV